LFRKSKIKNGFLFNSNGYNFYDYIIKENIDDIFDINNKKRKIFKP
jgi:hypothetical protein